MKGETAFGKYRLIAELGHGGMADVFLAVAIGPAGSRKLHVIKRVRRSLVEDPEFVAMLLEEGKLSSRLNHPNLIQTHEVGQLGDEYFIAMEYLDGQPLHRILSRSKADKRPLPLRLHCAILVDALRGLHHAHDLADFDGTPLGIVHRDVSPHNVFVTYDGDVKVVDFGVAKAAGRLNETQGGALKGKLAYMSPEQAVRVDLDRRADVFAVGVMLWEAATGRRLWKGAEEHTILGRLLTGDVPVSPRAVAPDVPPELDAICQRALAPDAADRYPSAEAMRVDLEAYLEKEVEHSAIRRELGPFVTNLFADTRQELRRAVEVQLRALDEEMRTPVHSTPAPVDDEETRVDTRQSHSRTNSRWPIAIGLASVAAVAVAGASGIGRSSSSSTKPAPAVSIASIASNTEPPPLLTEDCKQLIGDPSAPGAFVFGVLYPRSGAAGDVAKGDVAVHATALGLSEISSTVVGVPVAPGAQRRPLAAVVCDSTVNARRAATHLVNDLHVPAVLGPLYSSDALDIALAVTIPRNALLICPFATSSALSGLANDTLVWRTVTPSTYEARAIAPLVSMLEQRIRRDPNGHGPLRVAMIVNKGTLGLSTAEITTPLLRFNDGKDVLANAENFLRIDFDGPTAAYDAIAARVVAFRPDIIVSASLDELLRDILPGVERSWPADAPRPLYALNSDNVASALFPSFVASSPGFRRRVFGVTSHGHEDRKALDSYMIRYRAAFANGGPDDHPEWGASAYDAVYVLAYAAAAVGGEAPTGRDLARGMSKLVAPGAKVNVGPLDLDRAFHALAEGSNIDINGAAGALDFDTKTGDPTEDVVLRCFDEPPVSRFATDGAVYHATTGAVTGTMTCKDGRH